MMIDDYVKFSNDQGLREIGIGVTEFKCTGASPPNDHPHTYHQIEERGSVNCMYCNTKYIYRTSLARFETDPPGNSFED
ncbi:MAG TPA: zinc-finger domain-containing protein [Alphaproteobacteria bacterium]|nr:zinc-finger domain-containing protein [Alphaproteobacteria bacterium]